MVRTISRRAMLTSVAFPMATVALGGCSLFSSKTVNGVTTITVNLNQLDSWGQAIANAGTMLAPIVPSVGPAIMAVVKVVAADIAAIDKDTGGTATLTFDATSIPAAISSLLADGQTILKTATAALPAEITSEARTILGALQTIVSLFAAALGSMGAVKPAMTETQALAALRVTR